MPQLQDIQVDFVSLVDRPSVRDPQNKSEPRRFLLFKRADGQDDSPSPTAQGGDQMTADEMTAAVEKAEREVKEAHEATEKAQAEAKEATDALVAKEADGSDADGDEKKDIEEEAVEKSSLPPEVRAHIEKAEREASVRIAKAEEAAAEATKIAKEERDMRVEASYIQKAEGYRGLSIKPAEFGPLLKRASERLEKSDYDALETLLAATDKQLAASDLFREVGKSVGGSALPSDADGELQRKAQELRKSDSKLSQPDAEEHVLKNDHDLQRRLLAETR